MGKFIDMTGWVMSEHGFDNKEDAHIAYEAAKDKYFGEFGYKLDKEADAINVC